MIYRSGNQNVFKQLSIPQRLMFGFLLLIIPMIIIGIFSFYSLSVVEKDLADLSGGSLTGEKVQSAGVKDFSKEIEMTLARIKKSKIVMVTVMLLAIIISVLVCLIISRGLKSEIEKMQKYFTDMAGNAIDLRRIDELLKELRSLIHGEKPKDDS
jgi:ABC-type lipoprotein release transport system permease subunit